MSRRTALVCGSLRSAFVLIGLATWGCLSGDSLPLEPASEAAPEGPWLEEIGHRAGLDFVHFSGHRERFLMPEIMGGGAALFDADGDGDLDAFLVQGRPDGPESPSGRGGHGFFRNLGRGDSGGFVAGSGWRGFEDATADSGDAARAGWDRDGRSHGMGVATGDVDGDGDVDLYLTMVGPDVLLLNDGRGYFTDVTRRAELGDPGWGSSAAFFDAEGDGDLDLYVTHYLVWSSASEIECFSDRGRPDYCSPQSYDAPAVDKLYRNLGPGTDGIPRFEDLSLETGVGALPGTGLGLTVADFDQDLRPEIFVANDGMEDRLWAVAGSLPDGFPTYEDRAALLGCAVDAEGKAKAGMGVAVGDLDHDGDPDLMVCNLDRESDSVFRNEGGFFVDVTVPLGLAAASRPFTRFGMAWVDFDNDGLADLYQANGRVALPLAAMPTGDPFAEPNLLFRGLDLDGDNPRFEELKPRGGTSEPLVATSRAAAFGDVDDDGGIDILVVNRDARPYLLRNIVPGRGHWLTLDLRDQSGAPALGAQARLRIGESWRVHVVRSAFSYQAANDPRIHVGLGDAVQIDELHIRWPDGGESRAGPMAADRVLISTPSSAPLER